MRRNKQIETKDKPVCLEWPIQLKRCQVFSSYIRACNISRSLSGDVLNTGWWAPLQHWCMMGYIRGADAPTSNTGAEKACSSTGWSGGPYSFCVFANPASLTFDPSPRCEEQNRNLCRLCRVLCFASADIWSLELCPGLRRSKSHKSLVPFLRERAHWPRQ